MKCKNTQCPLHGKIEVPYTGNPKTKVIYVGGCPEYDEINMQIPHAFSGEKGKKTKELLHKAKIPLDSILFLNAARCNINKKEMSDRQITQVLKCCRIYVKKVLDVVKPKLIIIAGDYALRQILGRKGIKAARNEKWIKSGEFQCWCKPTYDTAYLSRNPDLERHILQDLKDAKKFIDLGYQIPENSINVDYKTVESIQDILHEKPTCGFDTEGQGLNWSDPNYVCISFAISPREGVARNVVLYTETDKKEEADLIIKQERIEGKKKKIVDVYVKKASNFDKKLDELLQFLEDKEIKKVMQNGKFDIHVMRTTFMRERGIKPVVRGWTIDIQQAAQLLNENTFNMADLVTLQYAFTDRQDAYDLEFSKKYPKHDMLSIPIKEMEFYSCSDADITRQVAVSIAKELSKNPRILNYLVKFCMPTLQSLMLLEENGVPIDVNELPKISNEVYNLMMNAQKQAWKTIPQKVIEKHKEKNSKKKDNIFLTRREFVADILHSQEGFNLPCTQKTKSGKPSTDKHSISKILETTKNKKIINFLENYQEFAIYQNLYSKYFKSFHKYIKHDNKIRSSLTIAKANTGRVSSSNPNTMNFPKRNKNAKFFRQLVKAPDGYLLLSADQSQSELRWMAHVANEKELIRIYNTTGADVHAETGKELAERKNTGKKWEDFSDEERAQYRRSAKVINFGLLFGMKPNGLVIYAKQEYGITIDYKTAEDWSNMFFSKYPGIPIYHKEAIHFCRTHGYVESPLGRRRHLPEINSSNPALRARAENQAVNHPIQSPSSDTVLIALNEMTGTSLIQSRDMNFVRNEMLKRIKNRMREKRDWGIFHPDECQPILFIHDELIFLVKDNSKLVDYAKKIKYYMENPPLERDFGVKLRVPLVSDPKIGKTLNEMKDLQF